jgi:hypothetical protein
VSAQTRWHAGRLWKDVRRGWAGIRAWPCKTWGLLCSDAVEEIRASYPHAHIEVHLAGELGSTWDGTRASQARMASRSSSAPIWRRLVAVAAVRVVGERERAERARRDEGGFHGTLVGFRLPPRPSNFQTALFRARTWRGEMANDSGGARAQPCATLPRVSSWTRGRWFVHCATNRLRYLYPAPAGSRRTATAGRAIGIFPGRSDLLRLLVVFAKKQDHTFS